MIIVDIINLPLGVFLLFNITLGIIALTLLFASWFFISVIFVASTIRHYSKSKYCFIMILSILSVVLGIMMVYNSFASLLTIAMLLGVYFIINGIIHIIQAF